MTLKSLEGETELNWLVRLKKTAARVGGWCACWSLGCVDEFLDCELYCFDNE